MDLAPDLAFLELKLKKGNYTDEACIEIEQSITRIKSLISQQTQMTQPISADVLANVSASIIKSLN